MTTLSGKTTLVTGASRGMGRASALALAAAGARGVSVADVQPIVILLFSQMIGALVLQIAGRLDQLQTDPFSLLRILLGQLRALPLTSVEDSCRGADRSKAKDPHSRSRAKNREHAK